MVASRHYPNELDKTSLFDIVVSALSQSPHKNMKLQLNTSRIFIKPLAILLSGFGILPWYSLARGKLTYPRIFKFYSTLLVLITATLSFSFFYARFQIIFPHSTTLLNVLDTAANMAGLVFVVVTLLGSSFWNMHIWELLLPKVEVPNDSILSTYLVFLGNVIMIILIFIDYFNNMNQLFLYYSAFFIYRYVYLLTTQAIFVFVDFIRYKYRSLNDLFYFKPSDVIDRRIIRSIKKIGKLYLELHDLTNIFNILFGWPLLLLFFNAVLQIQCILPVFIGLRIMLENVLYEPSTITLILNTAYVLELMVPLIAVIMRCETVAQEAEKSLTNCYKLENTILLFSDELEELENLKMVIIDRNPKLTAAGFFEIRRSTLVSLLSIITTYFIVVLQFSSL